MPNTYDVYIRRWKKADGTPSSASEKLMFSIPQNNPEGFPLLSPTVKRGEDSADSLDFSMNVGMEYYDLLIPFRTIIRVEYYGNTIFYGRVLTVNASTVMQTRSVHCEGAFGFFNDSYYPAIADTKREEISWSTYFDRILSNHNSYINGDDIKKFNRGTVDFTPTVQNKKFEPTGWTQTSSMLSSLKDELGGHMLSRYSGGYNYIDWYKYHKRDLGNGNRPVVQVGENVIDISSNMDVGNLFTRVIPVGKSDNDGSKITINGYVYTDRNGTRHTHGTDYMPVSLIRSLYSDAELSNDYHTPQDFDDSESEYGIIYKPVEFRDAATPEQLWNECAKWIKESFYGAVTSFEIRAIDMHIQNTSLPLILLGDCVDIYYKIMENGQMVTKYRKMIAKSIKYDLFNPSNNSYSFGIPSDLLKTSKSQSTSSKKKTASESMHNIPGSDDTPDKNLTFKKIADIIRKDPDVANGYGGDAAADSFIANGKLSGSVNVYDADIHYDPVGHPEICFTGQIVGKITISGKVTKWVAVNNAHGLFAYVDDVEASITGAAQVVAAVVAGNANVARPTTHWYIKKAGYTYTDFSVWQTAAATTSVQAVIAAAEGIAVYAGASSIVDLVGNTVKAATIDSVQGVVKTANKMALDVQNSIISLLPGQKNSSGNEIVSAQIGGNDGGKMSVFDEWGNKIMEAAGKDQKMSFYERIGSSMSGKVSASIQAASGTVASIVSKIGKDGSGEDNSASIIQDGTSGKTTFYDNLAGNLSARKTIEQNGLTGETSFYGTDTSSGIAKKVLTALVSGFGGGSFDLSSLDTNKGISMMTDNATNIIDTFVKKASGEKKTTSSVDGILGSMNSILNVLGTDGTGTKATIKSDGTTAKTTYVKPNAAGSTSANDKTIEVDGGGTDNEGKINVGGKGNGDWRVQLNNKVTYTDEHGDTYTLPGFVTAEDFSMLQSIPSFKTKYAVVDTLIAGKVTASTIQADLAYIRDLSSNTIKASRSVRAGYGYFTNGYITNVYASGHVYRTVNGNNVDLGRCYNQCLLSESGGVITLTMYPADGTDPVQNRDISSFNMAATTFYKNAVAAAFDSDHQMYISGAGSADQISSAEIKHGTNTNYYPTFKRTNGTYQYGSLIRVTPKAVTAGTSVMTWDSSNKQFKNYGYAYESGNSSPIATSAQRASSTLSIGDDSWSNGAKKVWVKHGSTEILSDTVSIPASSDTLWENITGRTWRARLTIGGAYRYSSTQDFSSYYDDGWNAATGQPHLDFDYHTSDGYFNITYPRPVGNADYPHFTGKFFLDQDSSKIYIKYSDKYDSSGRIIAETEKSGSGHNTKYTLTCTEAGQVPGRQLWRYVFSVEYTSPKSFSADTNYDFWR